MANRPNIHYHNVTIHHSDHETKLAKTLKAANVQQSFYPPTLPPPTLPTQSTQQQRHHYVAESFPVHTHRQAKSFDDSTLYSGSKKQTSFAHYPLADLKHHQHSQKHRRHSSTSRIKATSDHYHRTNSASETKNSNFISSITNNFMSFGAPFLFDWRLFCERGN